MTPKELADLVPEPQHMSERDAYMVLTPHARKWAGEHSTWGQSFFSEVYVNGGTVPKKNLQLEGVTEQDTARVLAWLRVGMSSMYPQHEDKTAVCGMLWQTFFINPAEEST